jgi:hypothetical protein
MHDLPEQPLAHEMKREHLHAAVVAVFHHHAVSGVLLGRFHQRPAVVHGHRRRHFDGRMLAVLHRRKTDRHVPFPRGRVVDEIQVRFGAQPLEVSRTALVCGGCGMTGSGDRRDGPGGALRIDIADRRDAAAGDRQQVADVRGAHAANADIADANKLDRRRSKRTFTPLGWFGCQHGSRRASHYRAGGRLEEIPSTHDGRIVWQP